MEAVKYNDMQLVKRRFFAMRNGIIADTLRSAGSPFKIIFGLNLPQIIDIASQTPHTIELAEQLWANTTTRESRLLAPMLYPLEQFDIDTARRWAATVETSEVADILCHRLLRHCPFATELAKELSESAATALETYTALRLAFNIVTAAPETALEIAGKLHTHPLARAVAEEANFILETKH